MGFHAGASFHDVDSLRYSLKKAGVVFDMGRLIACPFRMRVAPFEKGLRVRGVWIRPFSEFLGGFVMYRRAVSEAKRVCSQGLTRRGFGIGSPPVKQGRGRIDPM